MFIIYLNKPMTFDGKTTDIIEVEEIIINPTCIYFWYTPKIDNPNNFKSRINIFRWQLEIIHVIDSNRTKVIYVIQKEILEERVMGCNL